MNTSTVWVAGKFNNALDFLGVNSNLIVNDTVSGVLDFNDTDDLTIAGWVNRDTFTNRHPLVFKKRGTANTDDGYAVEILATGEIRAYFSDLTDQWMLTSVGKINTAGWKHFAVVFDQDNAAECKVYIDGVDSTGTKNGTLSAIGSVANGHQFRLGAESDGDSYLDGKLDDVRVYKRALSSAEVQQVMAGN